MDLGYCEKTTYDRIMTGLMMNYVYRERRKVINIYDENKQQLIFTQCFIILIILSGRCCYASHITNEE